jgi:hypothetical protein
VTVLLWVIALLILVAAGLEVWLRRVLIPRLARMASEGLGTEVLLRTDPGLHTVAVLRRHVPYLHLDATDVPAAEGRARLTALEVELRGIHLHGPFTRLRPTFERARFRAHLRWEDVREVVPLPPYLTDVAVGREGLRLTTLAGVAIDAHVDLHPGKVRVRPTGTVLRLLPTQNVVIDLPKLPLGATIDTMTLGDGTVDLAVDLF